MDPRAMKQIGRKISICMGVTISFFLSLTGTLVGGHFTLPGWIVSFLLSTVLSLVIGFVVPMHRVTEGASQKAGLSKGSLQAKAYEALISDLIYTPLITLCMVLFAWRRANAAAPVAIPFFPMFLKSLLVCLIVGFVMIFIFQPVYMKLFIKKPR